MIFAVCRISNDGFERKTVYRQIGKSCYRLAAVLEFLFIGQFG
jgi:hypothetical protein